jgi:hypothetical protein
VKGWGGAKAYNGEKAWSSIIISILSEYRESVTPFEPDRAVVNLYHYWFKMALSAFFYGSARFARYQESRLSE